MNDNTQNNNPQEEEMVDSNTVNSEIQTMIDNNQFDAAINKVEDDIEAISSEINDQIKILSESESEIPTDSGKIIDEIESLKENFNIDVDNAINEELDSLKNN